jgi:sugar lactone lactonase YvrE
MTSRQVRRLEPDGSLVLHADLSDIATHWCNDMLVDPEGRAYVGHFGLDLDAFVAEHGEAAVLSEDAPTRSHVMLVLPDGTVDVAADEMRFPNGTVRTPDGTTLIVAETLALRLTAFRIAEDGTLHDRRVWADLSEQLLPPDGICLDADGGIWVANALGAECVRVEEGGRITDRIATGQRAFACALGGDDGTTLFVCTAQTSEAAACTAERTARVEVATVDVPGAGSP